MALMGTDLARGVSRLVVEPDADAALAFADRDETIDAAHRDLFTTLLTRDARYDTQTAIDITLLGRYYERFADHAVAIARRLDFAAAGAPLRATARPIGSTA
jgi:phosphate transport system protein